MKNRVWLGCLLTASLGISGLAQADVKMPGIFGDHMVLQEGAKLPVWGTADAGEAITVTVSKESAKTTTGADGKWRIDLAPLPQSDVAVTMTIAGKNSLKFEDVLIGDVWICSGQSNMEFTLPRAHNAAEEMPKANDPSLRFFQVVRKTSLDPLSDVEGKWVLCTPDTTRLFSAAGYFYGRELRTNLNRPIGLIGSYWGGTPAQAWTSLSGLEKEPTLKHYVDQVAKNRADSAQATIDYPAKQEAFKAAMNKWKETDGKAFAQVNQEWKLATKKAIDAGQPIPPQPRAAVSPPRPPPTPDGGPDAATNLFNGMIAPLIPYAIKGAIWYQGESNVGQPVEYATLFPRMISDWREKWGQGDFPFLFVQLAAFKYSAAQSAPFLREAQLKTLSLPNTGMASAVDIGNPEGIHPEDKLDVGKRLALVARHVAYGQKLVYSGPIYQAMKVQGQAINVTFTQTGSGLIIGTAPWHETGTEPLSNATLVGFTIAGKDKNWVPAEAKIKGDVVIVSSQQVADPVAVRYDWRNAPAGNLYNKEELPASPFRTDNWPEIEIDKTAVPEAAKQ